MPLDEARGFYKLYMQYIKNRIEHPEKDYDTGYFIRAFGYFQKKKMSVTDLFKGRETIAYKRAKTLLDAYMELSKVRIKPQK